MKRNRKSLVMRALIALGLSAGVSWIALAVEMPKESAGDTVYTAEPVMVANAAEDGSNPAEEAMIDVLELKNMDITDVLKLLSEKTGTNIVAGQHVEGKVTLYVKNVKLGDALRIILNANELAYSVEDGIIRVMPAQEFEKLYGASFGGQMKTRIVRLLYAETEDLNVMLTQIKSPLGKIVADQKSATLVLTDTPEKLELMERLIAKIDVAVETRVFELNYAKAKDLAEKVQEFLTINVGRVKFDERSNKLVVTDTAQKIQQVAGVIKAFDTKETQVLIEAKIIQVILNDQHKFGVDWEAVVRDYHNLNVKSNFDILSATDKSGVLSIGTLDSDDYTALVHALDAAGITNILSSPRITAINNQEAKILVGSTQPYVTTTTTTPASGPTTIAESVNFIDVGVKLFVTPTIHKDNFITLNIRPEVSSVTRTLVTGNNNAIPVVETSEAETIVMVKDGVTIVIGGLIKDEKIISENKVPILGDIPLLKYAFRNEDILDRKTEIVIFLTPRIITGDAPEEEYQSYTGEVKASRP